MLFSFSAHIQTLRQQSASLLLYQQVLTSEIGEAFGALLRAMDSTPGNASGHRFDSLSVLYAYGQWFRALATVQQTWQDYLVMAILRDDNPFSRQVQFQDWDTLPPALIQAAQHDLTVLQTLYHAAGDEVSQWVQAIAQLPQTVITWPGDQATSPVPVHAVPPHGTAIANPPDSWGEAVRASEFYQHVCEGMNWADLLPALADDYRRQGSGLMATYRAFRWQRGELLGISHPDPVQLSELVGYERQKQDLVKNTEFLLAGYPALHVLLYGSRGSGKSSLVKSLLWEYGDFGLRMVEVAKADLRDLSAIADYLRTLPQKFIIFVDDLSFEEEEDAYKALKVVLEGNLTARPTNVVVYATSNRRHLIREFFGDRPRPSDADEIHAWDTVQEKLSFSDRFGLTLTFEPANQDTYLQMIHHLGRALPIATEELEYRALQWATRHNGRSGRTARQFIDFLKADLTLFGGGREGG